MTDPAKDLNNHNIGWIVVQWIKDQSVDSPGFKRRDGVRRLVGFAPGVVACQKANGDVMVIFNRRVWTIGLNAYQYKVTDFSAGENLGSIYFKHEEVIFEESEKDLDILPRVFMKFKIYPAPSKQGILVSQVCDWHVQMDQINLHKDEPSS